MRVIVFMCEGEASVLSVHTAVYLNKIRLKNREVERRLVL
jgi:hypothetical protein